jgi:hypothetical protein
VPDWQADHGTSLGNTVPSFSVLEFAQRNGLEVVDENGVHGGIGLALKVGDSFYVGDLSRLTPSQRRVLTSISHNPTKSPTSASLR